MATASALTRQDIEGLYQNLLGRRGDEEGINYWLTRTDLTPMQIAAQMSAMNGVQDSGYGYLLGDATYAPYLNNALLDKDQIEANRILKQSQLEANQQVQGGIYDTQRRDASYNVTRDYQNRGMSRSSGAAFGQARERSRVDQMQSAYDLGITNQINDVNFGASNDQAQVARGIQTEGQRALREATKKSYADAYSIANA